MNTVIKIAAFRLYFPNWHVAVSGEIEVGYKKNVLYAESGWALEQAPQGSGHGTNSDRV